MKRRYFLRSIFGATVGLATVPSIIISDAKKIKAMSDFESDAWWNIKGCKDCFRECVHFNDCKAELEKRVAIYD